MEKPTSKIRVLDRITQQVLFECSVNEHEKAYEYAAQMEEMGLDIVINHPTLSETLSDSLGLSNEARAEYQRSMEEELEEHEGSCCFKNDDEKGSIH